jgi:VanZ family protein
VNKLLAHPALIIAFWLACTAVATLSLLPVAELPPITMNLWDKAQHATGFFCLGVLGWLAYHRIPLRLCIGLLVFGMAIEVAQSATGWRTGDALDWLADAVGVLFAMVAMRQLVRSRP